MALSILQFVNVHSTAATFPMPNSKLQFSNVDPGLKAVPSTRSLNVTSSNFTGPSIRTCCQRVIRAELQLNHAPSLKITSSSNMLARAGNSIGVATTLSEISSLQNSSRLPQLNWISTRMQPFNFTSRPPIKRQPLLNETSQRTVLLAGISIDVVTLLLETSRVHSLQSLSSRASLTSVRVQLSIFTSFPPRTWQP